MTSYLPVNRRAWAQLAESGSDASRPFGVEQILQARAYLDPDRWIDWAQIDSVLCLGAGGGQQSLLCASLGLRVTVADISPEQLALDQAAAARHEFRVETVLADMLGLGVLHGRDFDLVYQPVSTCYVPDVRAVYHEVHAVLRRCGLYFAEHWNPTHMQLEPGHPWKDGYRLVRRYGDHAPHAWSSTGGDEAIVCWHYIHPLSDLLGGLGDSGFAIRRFAERGEHEPAGPPGSETHLSMYVPTFLRVLAQRDEA
jgi:SAM-dependent methyltransferase